MAPEAIQNPATVDARTDLYSLGAVAYLLLTGHTVFGGATAIEACAHHLHTEPVAPSARLGQSISADLEAILMRCLAKDPRDRYASASELAAALASCADAGTWRTEDADAWWARYRERVEQRRAARGVAGSSALALSSTALGTLDPVR
jgi:serine/threonine-protein kinase